MVNLDSAEYVLTTTRSVRKRLDFDKPVDRREIEDCLEVALQAPNGSNLNTWRWIIVDDPSMITEISRLYGQAMDDLVSSLGENTGENYMASHIPKFESVNDSVDYLRENMSRVPMIAFPLMEGRTDNASVFYQASMWGSILQSVWSFFLALRTKGMGSAWTTAHIWREKEFAQLLGINPEQYTQVGLFPIAHTKGLEFRPAWRKPVNEILSWNTLTN